MNFTVILFYFFCRNLEGSLLYLMKPGRTDPILHLYICVFFFVCVRNVFRVFACYDKLIIWICLWFWLNFSVFLIWRICSASSMFPKSTHETFSQKLYQTFKTHKRFIKPKLSRTDFTIAHYAGEVFCFMHFLLCSINSAIWVAYTM